MLDKRLKGIASLVDNNSIVLDIGTDHAYLPIYLYKEGISKKIIASDKSSKVLEQSLNNLKKNNLEDKIKLVLSDGFKNIDDEVDVAVIAGMGTKTIIDILNTEKIPNTIIIESNNDHYELRSYLNKIGYKIDKEIVVLENGIYYDIIKYIKGFEKLDRNQLLFGKSNNLEYFKYLLEKFKNLYYKSKACIHLEYVQRLEAIIEKIPD